MGLSRQDIIDYALRYMDNSEVGDFPHEGDLFCFVHRKLTSRPAFRHDEGWAFAGYGICMGYALDENSKPPGKWIWFYYVSLNTYPPDKQVIRLQPPHVAKGTFQTEERSEEVRIVKIPLREVMLGKTGGAAENGGGMESGRHKILKFPSQD